MCKLDEYLKEPTRNFPDHRLPAGPGQTPQKEKGRRRFPTSALAHTPFVVSALRLRKKARPVLRYFLEYSRKGLCTC